MKEKEIVFVEGNREIVLKDGDKANLEFNINFEIGVTPSVYSRKIVINDVKIEKNVRFKQKRKYKNKGVNYENRFRKEN